MVSRELKVAIVLLINYLWSTGKPNLITVKKEWKSYIIKSSPPPPPPHSAEIAKEIWELAKELKRGRQSDDI